MTMLHTVNKSPFEKNSLASCLNHATNGSAVLLIEDGVYGALQGTSVSDAVKAAMGNVSIYALQSDIDARGVNHDRLIENIKLIDYSGFVDLAAEHPKVQSWL